MLISLSCILRWGLAFPSAALPCQPFPGSPSAKLDQTCVPVAGLPFAGDKKQKTHSTGHLVHHSQPGMYPGTQVSSPLCLLPLWPLVLGVPPRESLQQLLLLTTQQGEHLSPKALCVSSCSSQGSQSLALLCPVSSTAALRLRALLSPRTQPGPVPLSAQRCTQLSTILCCSFWKPKPA